MKDRDRDRGAADLGLYTPDEAAEITSFSRWWLMDQAKRGLIPHRRYGARIVRFAAEDLEQIKQMGARPAASAHRPKKKAS